MTLRDIFRETKGSNLYRYLHFRNDASDWTLDTEVLVDDSDLGDEHDPRVTTPEGCRATVFSSDVEHVVQYADQLRGSADDDTRLSALRYYYHHGHRVFEDWRP